MTCAECQRIARVIGALFALCAGLAENLPSPVGSFRALRFSPDGRYALAQDDSEITVLSVQPFAILFRIPAADAGIAKFTPDSIQVVFVSGAPRVDPQRISFSKSPGRVERWSIAGQNRSQSTELPALVCGTEELAPDSGSLACVDLKGTLLLLDVGSGRIIFEKKKFNRGGRSELESATIYFSPDGQFIALRPGTSIGSILVSNVHEGRMIKLEGELKQLGQRSFAFVAPDRIVMSAPEKVENVKIVAFPSGKALSAAKIPDGVFYPATDPGFVLIRPFGRSSGDRWKTAAVELSSGKVVTSDGALDVFSPHYIAELVNGKAVGLYEAGNPAKPAIIVVHGASTKPHRP